jgi:calcineurin-like phosphoesterase family protein
MTTFFSSDWHLSHKRISEFCPFSRKGNAPQEMNELIFANISKQVKRGDVIYNIGDISFGKEEETLKFLNAIKRLGVEHHLILGNHDYAMKKNPRLLEQFNSVQDYKEAKIQGQNIVMSHFPMETWSQSHRGAWMLHGHKHSTHQPIDNMRRMDVGLDSRPAGDMTLWSFEEIKKIMDNCENTYHH